VGWARLYVALSKPNSASEGLPTLNAFRTNTRRQCTLYSAEGLGENLWQQCVFSAEVSLQDLTKSHGWLIHFLILAAKKRFSWNLLEIHQCPKLYNQVFAETSPKRSFSMTEYERFGLVFTKTRVYKFGHCFP
jgi:hypothetical protein